MLQAIFYCALLTISANEATPAPADSLPWYTCQEIVVTAKRVPSKLEQLAFSVSVIDRSEIDLALSNSPTDLAGTLPGVFVQKTGSFGRSDVSIRGLGSRGRRAVVLIDGRPERMALFDCTVTHTFQLHDVERIEVVRGPASVLYGSGAMGGVLNVIPRQYQGNGLSLRTSYGSYGTVNATGRAEAGSGPIEGALSLDYRTSDGHLANSAFEGFDAAARAGFTTTGGMELRFAAKYFDGYKEEPIRFTDSPDEISDTWNNYRRGSLDLLAAGETRGAGYQIRYYRSFGEHEFSDGWHSKDATDGAILHVTGQPIPRLEIAGGADGRLQRGEQLEGEQEKWDKWEGGVYCTMEYSAADRFIFSGGARYNHDKYADGELCPAFGLIVVPRDGTTIRANAARAFRTPQLNELFMFPSSNENLNAETAWSYELGLRQRFWGGSSIDLAGFVMKGEDLIETVPNSTPPPLFYFENAGSFEFMGGEAVLNLDIHDCLKGRLSYTYLNPGEWTKGRPGGAIDLTVIVTTDNGSFRLTGKRVDDYYASNDHLDPIDSYNTIDFYAETKRIKGLILFAGVENLFDERYALFVDLPGGEAGLYEMPGRTVFGGLKFVL